MNSRHRAREIALQILYQYDLAQRLPVAKLDTRLVGELKNHYDHFQVPPELRTFVGDLVAGSLGSVKELDALLEKHTANWKVSRLSAIDRCILRMAVYEMLHFPEMPRAVIIDEAVELAKAFGSDDSSSFVNGVLDQVLAPEAEKANVES